MMAKGKETILRGGEGMADKTYSGRIKNQGAQKVEAIYKTGGKSKSTSIKGDDLRMRKNANKEK